MEPTISMVKGDDRPRRAEHAADTRRAIVGSARELFASVGYPATTLDDVARRARVTKGAVYHHFAGKQELFRAVVAELRLEAVDRVRERLAATGDWSQLGDVWDRISLGCLAYLDAVGDDPAFQRIVVVEAPAVLGTEVSTSDADLMYEALAGYWLEQARDQALIAPMPIMPFRRILYALIEAASRDVVGQGSSPTARAEVRAVVERILQGLRAPG